MSHSSDSSTATEAFPDLTITTSPGDGRTTSPSAYNPANPLSQPRVHYSLNVNTQVPLEADRLSPLSPTTIPTGIARSDTELSRAGVRRRNTRTNTFRTIQEFEEGWRPGAEPGVDPSKPDGGHSELEVHAECQITIVDFSEDQLSINECNNQQMIDFLLKPQPDWAKCRWINVNGRSWDVIQALGNYKNLHKLALEDVLNNHNRTKADWYSTHAFFVLTCQKLVKMVEPDSSDDEGDDHDRVSINSHGTVKTMPQKLQRWWRSKRSNSSRHAIREAEVGRARSATNKTYLSHQATGFSDVFNPATLCTLQRYRAGMNDARTEFMEKNSALASRGLAVMAEQVCIFITSDNTIIAFFEQSADDVERPILARLQSPDTILRQSCDASMVGQAIIDAIIDMAIPVASCYSDVIGDLEMDILLKPTIKHTKQLYIIVSEVNKMFSFVNPIAGLINAMKDHKTTLTEDHARRELQNPLHGVIITPMTYTYLGDVYDHCMLITENLNQIKESANMMIDLIFNTISAYQNESISQLTSFTIAFLPMTFITGYFGMNFEPFPSLLEGIMYFWWIAIPVAVVTALGLMREPIMNWIVHMIQRRKTNEAKRQRKERARQAKAQRIMKTMRSS